MARTALLAALGALLLVGAGTAATTPRVRIADNSPFELAGSGFVAGEKVFVTVEFRSTTYERSVRAGDAGAFRVRFAEVKLSRCGPDLDIRVRGNRGSRVQFTLHHLHCDT
jgi:hypothetical protein